MRVRNKIAIVTGAGSGIGRACAETLSKEGASVYATDVRENGFRSEGDGIVYRRLDVRCDEDWRALVADVMRRHGRVDILVNAAGIADSHPLHLTESEKWDDVVAVNQTGLMFGLRSVIPAMIETGGGSIILISSIFGLGAVEGIAAYHATKGAVTMMARNAAVTYAKDLVRVNSVHPGLIDTPMARARTDDGQSHTIAMTPLGRIGSPWEVANAVLFLASDEASYITGVQLPVDGGYLAK